LFQFDLVSFGCWVSQNSSYNWFVYLFVWWVKCSHFTCLVSLVLTFGCLVSRVLTIWFLLPFWFFLFGESGRHNLVSSPPFDSSDCTSPTFDDSLVAPLLVLLYDYFSLPVFFCLDGSLFDWLIVMVLAALSTKINHFGCCSPLVLLTT